VGATPPADDAGDAPVPGDGDAGDAETPSDAGDPKRPTDAGTPPGPDAGPGLDPDAGPPARLAGPAPWSWTERLELAPVAPGSDERWRPECERSGSIRAAFGGDPRPRSHLALLHHLAGPGTRGPVLLVHGAATDASDSFGPQPFGTPSAGLAPTLAARGHAVYAVTFAHPHGGNLRQSALLGLAVARVESLHEGPVQLVAHSKGNVAAWALMAGLAAPAPARVRRWVAVGAPLDGLDFTFAWPNSGFSVVAASACAPLPWDRALLYGVWTDTTDRSLYAAGAFPGQAELLRRHDAEVGLPPLQPDGVTTYLGGQGAVSHSLGIDVAIAQGGHFLDRLAASPIPDGVELVAIAGGRHVLGSVVGENRAASDGLVLVSSATATRRAGRPDARRLVQSTLNHVELVTDAAGLAAIAAEIEAPLP
jgi:hypothetical protein